MADIERERNQHNSLTNVFNFVALCFVALIILQLGYVYFGIKNGEYTWTQYFIEYGDSFGSILAAISITFFLFQMMISSEERLDALLEAEKDALNQSYEQLSESFDELIDMNSNTEGYVRVTLYNVSFEYPEDLLVTVDSLYPGSQIASSGIFIATSASFDQVVSLSWENVDSEPNLTLVFDDTFGSFGNVVTMNQSSVHNYLDQELLFVSFDVSHPDSSNNFYLVSNWYDEVTQYHFVLIIQSYRNDVIDQFESFVSSYRSIDS